VARLTLPADLQRHTGGRAKVAVSARNYRDLVSELRQRFPDMTDEVIGRQAIAIDGVIIQTPLLETFHENSELVFIARIAGG
jgi:molybdopterin converting factor small subunit